MARMDDEELERSAVVANCRMNRERNLVGSNGYDKELGFNPLDFLGERVASGRHAAWLDLCCGTGRALIQASRLIRDKDHSARIAIVGVDLVGMFDVPEPDLASLRLVEASLRSWAPDRLFDLITCVHGLHYLGDKLGLIARTASWLTGDGLFVANLDLSNLKIEGRSEGCRAIVTDLRKNDLEYNRSRRRIACRGRKDLVLPYRYLGGDDGAGPNYTGQPAVDSYYERT
jgi:trans-aconitate methyltransferase